MNVAALRAQVKTRVGDTSGAEVSDADILSWINMGMVELARRTQQPQAVATTTSLVGVGTYSLTAFAADILRLRSVMYDGSVLPGISLEEADTLFADRENPSAANGTPSYFWMWADQINLWPRPDVAGKQLKLYYVKRPADVAIDADVPGIPLHMHTDLLEYVMAQALEGVGEQDRAGRRLDRFEAGAALSAADAEWPQRDTYPHVTVAADDAWQF